jgi:tetratricopeptide (TPR) repeat protein
MKNKKNITIQALCCTLGILLLTNCQSTSTSDDSKTYLKKPVHKYFQRYQSLKINSINIKAWENFHKKEFEQAALDFERLYLKKYRHYDSTFGAGLSFMKYYNLNKSLKYLNITLRKRPNHFEAIYFRALINIEIKNYAQARKDLTNLLTIKKTSKFLCGLHLQDVASQKILKKRHKEALSLLKTL